MPNGIWKTIRPIALAYSVLVGLFFVACFPEFCPAVPIHPAYDYWEKELTQQRGSVKP